MNRNLTRFSLYFDDAPLKPNTPGTGLSRINSHILNALSADSEAVIVRGSSFENSIYRADKAPYFVFQLASFLRKLPVFGTKLLSSKFLNLLDEFTIHPFPILNDSFLFCPIGTDLQSLVRASIVSKRSGASLAFFLVDDLFDNLKHNPKQSELAITAEKILTEAAAVFCVTENLVNKMKAYAKHVNVLYMPYEPITSSANLQIEELKNQIIFLGNPSHFYQDGLRALANMLPELGASAQISGLRATYGEKFFRHLPRRSTSSICVKNIRSEAELASSLKSAMLAFFSYSFDPKFKEMSETSFPSKLYEYLSFAERIVVWAPEYSSAATFFRKHNLPGLCTDPDQSVLLNFIADFVKGRRNFSPVYKKSMNEFSYLKFKSTLTHFEILSEAHPEISMPQKLI